MTDLEKDKILLLADSVGKMARELQSIKRLLKEMVYTPQTDCYMCKWMGDRDVCGRCRNRNLFAEADTELKPKDESQTDCDKCIWSVCNYNEVEWDADTPQTDLSEEEFVEGMKNLKMEVKQTDCGWK